MTRDKTRQNLLVSIDDRLTGDQEAMSLKTTSSRNIIIEFNSVTNKMSVDMDDLQDALNQVRTFVEARPKQPETLQPMGLASIEAVKDVEQRVEEQTKTIEKKFDLTN